MSSSQNGSKPFENLDSSILGNDANSSHVNRIGGFDILGTDAESENAEKEFEEEIAIAKTLDQPLTFKEFSEHIKHLPHLDLHIDHL